MLETLSQYHLAGDNFLQMEKLRIKGTSCANLEHAVAGQPVLITGGDQLLTEARFNALNQPTLKLWLAQNCACFHPKVRSLPLGLPDFAHDAVLGNTATYTKKNQTPKKLRNLVYMGFRDSTNPQERQRVRGLFEATSFTTVSAYDRSPEGHAAYLDNVYNHAYVLSPRGNGVDCHRTWETLYLRSIPIVLKHPVMDFAQHLPILFVDSWEQASDENFLIQQHDRLHALLCDFSILRLSYWLDLITSALNSKT